MGISIKHDEYERLIRRLASERDLSLTDAIGLAVKRELERDAAAEDERQRDFLEKIRAIQAEVAKHPVIDPRPYRDILYDEDGLPK